MPQYTAPLRDMQFVLHELLQVEDVLKTLPPHADTNRELIDQVLEEGGKFTAQVLFPLNHSGDREGCHYDQETKTVTPPKGFKEAYQQYVEAGWAALACDPEFGGQGLPLVMNNSFYEMLNSANQAWTMYPGLSHGAYECLHAHGSDDQKALYLPKLVSGEWTGTMCLTESHCGTDLGLLRSKAEPQADGSYKITGSKIFISAGEHDLSSNIVHLVLARESGRRSRLAHRRTAQGFERDVRLHECGASGRWYARSGFDRSGLPKCTGLCQGSSANAQPVRRQGTGQGS